MTTPPPGYYPDGSGTSRWWDGERWADLQPPAPRRGPLVAVLVVVGLVVVAGIGVGAWVLTRPDDGRTPRATVQALVDGMIAGDCDRVEAVTTEEYRNSTGLDCATIESFPDLLDENDAELEVGKQVASGDTSAEVLVQTTYGDGEVAPQPYTTRFTLTLVEGEWLVNADADADADTQE